MQVSASYMKPKKLQLHFVQPETKIKWMIILQLLDHKLNKKAKKILSIMVAVKSIICNMSTLKFLKNNYIC